MTRRPDWEARLAAYLSTVAEQPHSYGKHDCMLFPAGAVRAMTGKDYARGHRGKYRSVASSVRYLRSLGFDSQEAMLDSLFDEKPPAFAQRGDIVLDLEGIPGVCIGGDALFVGAEGSREGLVRQPRSAWRKAYAV